MAQSGSLDGLLKLINQYCMSTECKIDNGHAYNGKGKDLGTVEKKGKHYIFYRVV